ncbi:MAG: type I methionyl aminopeptidase [Clostridiales bacterium]|jgi:methionyl aminopeptidase|nr:type I methionyl aminopeptidase [Clostridiales bacterium]
MVSIKNKKEIDLMIIAGGIVAETLDAIQAAIEPGISTKELDSIALRVIKKNGATPSFYQYGGFPGNVCLSINDRVIHGIPSRHEILREGDIISVDAGACYKGYHGDAARTFGVGKISAEAQRLIDTTRLSFFEGIKQAVEGNRISDISKAIFKVADDAGYGVVRDYVGHGVGSKLHEEPEVPNYDSGKPGVRLYRGMTIAVEPMVNQGTAGVKVLDDDWTVVTADGGLSAHYENTILITDGEPMVLTEKR